MCGGLLGTEAQTRFCNLDGTSVGAGLPAITGKAGAMHRGACIAGKPAPTMSSATSVRFVKTYDSWFASVCGRARQATVISSPSPAIVAPATEIAG